MEKQVIEIIRQRDEYPFSVEVSTNSKGEAQFSAKIRFETLTDGENLKKEVETIIEKIKDVCKEKGIKMAGGAS